MLLMLTLLFDISPPYTITISVLYLLSLNLPNFLNGIIRLPFMELSIIIFRDININGCAGWPGSILMAKGNHFRC